MPNHQKVENDRKREKEISRLSDELNKFARFYFNELGRNKAKFVLDFTRNASEEHYSARSRESGTFFESTITR